MKISDDNNFQESLSEDGEVAVSQMLLLDNAGLMGQIAWGVLRPEIPETHAKSSSADLNPVGYPYPSTLL
jgi:hypothetical protein